MKRIIAGAVCCLSLNCGAALANAAGDAPNSSLSVDDEIIVLGKNWGEIRAQKQRAEEAVYDRFNEINSNDEFDIHCYREAPPGTRILQRVCESNAWRAAVAKMGQAFLREMQGNGFGAAAAVYYAEAKTKNALLAEEMKQLAVQDAELRQDIWHLANLEQGIGDLLRSGARPGAAKVAQQTAEQGALPYDAALAADVRMGRKAWTHPLTHRTFTFAHVYGEIEQIAVACRGEQGQLKYELGGEWTLPADWRYCTLRVEAPFGTTFTLYEFE